MQIAKCEMFVYVSAVVAYKLDWIEDLEAVDTCKLVPDQ